MSPGREAALQYAAKGWPVLPLHSPTVDGRCSCDKAACPNPGKHPRTPHGLTDATVDKATIRRWWRSWPTANVGLLTGERSGLVVLDVDPRHGGDEALRQLESQYGKFPATVKALSGGGGHHVVFAHPGKPVKNTVGALGPGLDLKGDGGYIVAPPSLHISGRRYQWEVSSHPDKVSLAPLPAWLLELIERAAHGGGNGQGGAEVQDWLGRLQGVHEGQRHDFAVRIAGHYLGIGWKPEEVETLLLGFASQCSPPHDPDDIRRIVRDLAAKDAAKAEVRDSFLSLKGELGKETNFRPIKAADLLANRPETIPWVWEPFLPEGGLVLLAAFMKVGKSAFAHAMAVAVAQGIPFLDFPTKQGGVLILAVEEHPRDVERRLRRFGMRSEDSIHVHVGPLDHSPKTLNTIRQFILDNGISLVVLDTLARYWGIRDENDNAQVREWVSPLLDLARETGAVVLLVHHERKTAGEDGRGIRGGSALFGLVDQALILDRRQGGESTHRTLSAIGRYDETPREVVLALVGDAYRKLGTAEELNLEAAKAKVWEALSEEPRDVPALAKETGLKEKETRRALEALRDQVIREGKGRKGDPYTYRQATPDSIRSQINPIGEETNVARAEGTSVALEEVDL